MKTNIYIKVKFYNGLFTEPTHIIAEYDNKKYLIKFSGIGKKLDIKKNVAEFTLYNPYIDIIGKDVLLDRYDISRIEDNAEIFFSADYNNILFYKTSIRIERHWTDGGGYTDLSSNLKPHGIKETDITDKQWKFIFDIERKLDVCFDGETKIDARDFISKYKNEIYVKKDNLISGPCACVWDDGMAWERMESY